MPNTIFMEPGTDATQDISFWNVATGTFTSDATVFFSGSRSLRIEGNAANSIRRTGVMADAGRRMTFRFRTTVIPSAGVTFMTVQNSGGSAVFQLLLTAAGNLQITAPGGGSTQGSTTLAVNTWYRIAFAFTVTSPTVYAVRLYIEGKLEAVIPVTGTLTNTGCDRLQFGNTTNSGTGNYFYFDDIFVDDGTDLGDPGNIIITCKRPIANGALNEWTTQIGSGGSGVGTGHAPQVNERPLSTLNGWSITNAAKKTEVYTIEGAAAGDLDITPAKYSIVDYMGWVSAKVGVANTGNIIVNGVATNINLTTAYLAYFKAAGATTYPSGTSAIGMDTNTINALFSLAECGIMVALVSNVAAAATDAPTTSESATDAKMISSVAGDAPVLAEWADARKFHTTFMEPGTSATNGFEFWNGANLGTFVSDGTNPITPPRSIRLNCSATAAVTRNGCLADTGRRITLKFRCDALPSVATAIVSAADSTNVGILTVSINPNGTLLLNPVGGTFVISNLDRIQPNVPCRLAFSYVIVNATTFSVKLYLNGVLQISMVNSGTLTSVGTANLRLTSNTNFGTANFIYFDDIYVDDGNDLTDPGNIVVLAKRPFSNGFSNDWTTQIGVGSSGYGSGHALQVNERPLSTVDGWSITNAAKKTELYAIEDKATGDWDVTPSKYQIVDYMGWVNARTNPAGTGNMIVGGVSFAKALATAYATYQAPAGSSFYPGDGQAIGMDNNALNQLFSLAECGILLAVIANVSAAAAEAPATAESVLRGFSYANGASDAPHTAEAGNRLGSLLRGTLDAPQTAEGIVPDTISAPRSASDAPTTAESILRLFNPLRAATDAPHISEGAARVVSQPRTTIDGLLILEAILRLTSAPRTGAESLSLAEAIARLVAEVRTATDAPATAESINRLLGAFRSNADQPFTSEAAVRALTMPRVVTDNVLVAMAVSRILSGLRTTTDNVATAESVLRLAIFTPTPVDSLTVALVVGQGLQAIRTSTDAPHTAEVMLEILGADRAAIETPAVAELLTRATTLLRSNSDAPGTSENVTRLLSAFRNPADAPHTADLVARLLSAGRATTDAVTIAELIARLVSEQRTGLDQLTLLETLLAARSLPRTMAEALATADVATAIRGVFTLSRNALDAVTLSDAATRLLVGHVNATENLIIAEIAARVGSFARGSVDHLTLAESVARVFGPLVSASDALILADAAARHGALGRLTTEHPAIAEMVLGGRVHLFTATDFLHTADLAQFTREGAVVLLIVHDYVKQVLLQQPNVVKTISVQAQIQ
jgi:concanavalin A-like lectin/glucanase superfamily protein